MKNLKKLGVILAVAAVVIGCVLAAGCTDTTSTPSTPTIPSDLSKVTPTLTVDVVKTGNAIYNIGDTFSITLPSNPSTGFSWKNLSDAFGDGVKVTEKEVTSTTVGVGASDSNTATALVGVGGSQTFTFTAVKEGTNVMCLGYQKGTDDPIYVYADLLLVEKSDNNHSHGEFTYEGDYTPQIGEVALVTARGNPTTGYELYVDKEEAAAAGLTVQESYETSNSGLLGAGGTYNWYVTTTQPGIYILNVYEKDARDGSSTLKFFVPLTFVLEA